MPTTIALEISEKKEGITFKSGNIYGKIIVEGDKVIALVGDLKRIDFKIFEQRNKNCSTSLRERIIDFFKEKGKQYRIGSDDLNLPIIEPLKSILSISHHGRYGVVAFFKNIL